MSKIKKTLDLIEKNLTVENIDDVIEEIGITKRLQDPYAVYICTTLAREMRGNTDGFRDFPCFDALSDALEEVVRKYCSWAKKKHAFQNKVGFFANSSSITGFRNSFYPFTEEEIKEMKEAKVGSILFGVKIFDSVMAANKARLRTLKRIRKDVENGTLRIPKLVD